MSMTNGGSSDMMSMMTQMSALMKNLLKEELGYHTGQVTDAVVSLKGAVTTLKTEVETLKEENHKLREALTDLKGKEKESDFPPPIPNSLPPNLELGLQPPFECEVHPAQKVILGEYECEPYLAICPSKPEDEGGSEEIGKESVSEERFDGLLTPDNVSSDGTGEGSEDGSRVYERLKNWLSNTPTKHIIKKGPRDQVAYKGNLLAIHIKRPNDSILQIHSLTRRGPKVVRTSKTSDDFDLLACTPYMVIGCDEQTLYLFHKSIANFSPITMNLLYHKLSIFSYTVSNEYLYINFGKELLIWSLETFSLVKKLKTFGVVWIGGNNVCMVKEGRLTAIQGELETPLSIDEEVVDFDSNEEGMVFILKDAKWSLAVYSMSGQVLWSIDVQPGISGVQLVGHWGLMYIFKKQAGTGFCSFDSSKQMTIDSRIFKAQFLGMGLIAFIDFKGQLWLLDTLSESVLYVQPGFGSECVQTLSEEWIVANEMDECVCWYYGKPSTNG